MADPVFWAAETSGEMGRIVKAWLNKSDLSPLDYKTLQWYVCQWINAMPVKPGDYDKVLNLSPDELRVYLDILLIDYFIDPF